MPIDPSISLQVRPMENPLDIYGKSLSIKSMQQQQKAQQQEAQMRDMQLKQQQQEMQDQQTIMQTLAQTGGDVDKALPQLGGKVSPKTFMQLQKSHLETRKTLAEIGDKELAVKKYQNDTLLGMLQQAQAMPDDQYIQAWPQLVQQAQAVHPELQLDPSQPVPKEQLQQYGLGLMTSEQYLAREADRRAALKATDEHAAAEAELPGKQAGSQEKVRSNYATILAMSKDQGDYEKKRDRLPFAIAKQFPDVFDKQAILNAGMTPDQQTTTDLTRNGQQIALRGQNITMRGQNMTDARSREQNQIARDTKMDMRRNQEITSLSGFNADMDRLATAANELKDHPGLGRITGLSGKAPNIPGMAGANAKAKLDTLKSQVAFSVLQNLRNQSKTGGALGQVSDKEEQMLSSNLAGLDTAQSEAEFKKSLQKIIDYANGAKQRAKDAYDRQFGTEQRAAPKINADPLGIR